MLHFMAHTRAGRRNHWIIKADSQGIRCTVALETVLVSRPDLWGLTSAGNSWIWGGTRRLLLFRSLRREWRISNHGANQYTKEAGQEYSLESRCGEIKRRLRKDYEGRHKQGHETGWVLFMGVPIRWTRDDGWKKNREVTNPRTRLSESVIIG